MDESYMWGHPHPLTLPLWAGAAAGGGLAAAAAAAMFAFVSAAISARIRSSIDTFSAASYRK